MNSCPCIVESFAGSDCLGSLDREKMPNRGERRLGFGDRRGDRDLRHFGRFPYRQLCLDWAPTPLLQGPHQRISYRPVPLFHTTGHPKKVCGSSRHPGRVAWSLGQVNLLFRDTFVVDYATSPGDLVSQPSRVGPLGHYWPIVMGRQSRDSSRSHISGKFRTPPGCQNLRSVAGWAAETSGNGGNLILLSVQQG